MTPWAFQFGIAIVVMQSTQKRTPARPQQDLSNDALTTPLPLIIKLPLHLRYSLASNLYAVLRNRFSLTPVLIPAAPKAPLHPGQ
jgi:hypothetical protein